MKSNHKKKVALGLGLLIMILTLFRENFFLEINAIIDGQNINRANFYLFYDFLISYTPEQLVQLKFIITAFFLLAFISLTYLTINYWFSNKKFNKITLVAMGTFVVVFILMIFLIKILGFYSENYFIFRKAIGFLQSPLPLFIMLSLFLYLDNDKA